MSEGGRTRAKNHTFPAALRPKSIRAKTVALLIVPVLSLVALWALATATTAQQAWSAHRAAGLDADLSAPVDGLIDALQEERDAVALHLAAPGTGSGDLGADRANTEAAATELRNSLREASPGAAVQHRADALLTDLRSLPKHDSTWQDAYSAYGDTIDSALALSQSLADAQEGTAAAHARVAVRLTRIDETLQRQATVVGGALTTGRFTVEEHQAFARALGGQRTLTAALLPDLSPEQAAAYRDLVESVPYRTLTGMQDSMLAHGTDPVATVGISANGWRNSLDQLDAVVERTHDTARDAQSSAADARADTARDRAMWTAALGLLGVILALVISTRIARGLVRDLVGLRDSALELAHHRLPGAMQRIRAGQKADEDPAITPGEGEIGEVGAALNAVQRSALTAAADRAELLTDVSGVFNNLARRSQSLVHRQLELLDTMKKHADDPADQGDLLRLGHLAARMRRHAEGLIVMSGATPGRSWRSPVPLMSVLRSAVTDVEDHARIDLGRMPELSVVGPAVSDLTRLFTEIAENATAFSPPDSTVRVRGGNAEGGALVEIEDNGLGMHDDKLAEANETLEEGHRLELFDSDRIGLFVVSCLAHRQGVEVSLHSSPAGATTARVHLPSSILTPTPGDSEHAEPEPAQRSPQPAQATGLPQRTPGSARGEKVWTEPEESDDGAVEAETVEGELPKRTRRANLAAPLKTAGKSSEDEQFAGELSPETAQALISALKHDPRDRDGNG
ncbi:nitrate- and nitrite sensing domain-containing protein [Saccharopolyspora halophila]|uniref:histidine kinase n=1 Tax=Saccharopolyspora halophila TaxID=405551 RepID=A0ABN3GGJ9_9PSEU